MAAEPIEGLTKEDAWDLMLKAWHPLIPAMAKIHAEQALEDSKQGFYVREAIFDRLFDKPKQRIDSVEHRQISIVIRPYTDQELASKEQGLLGPIIEGEARVLDVELPEPAPAPQDNAPSQIDFSLRVVEDGAENS